MTITVDLSPWSVLWFGTGGISKGAHWIHLWPVLRQNPTVSWQGTPKKKTQSGWISISHHLRLFSLQYLFETPCLLGYVWSKTHPPGSSMISVEFVGSPGLQNKSQQRASAKNCHQTTYGQPDVFFEKSRNHARLIQLIFWLVDVGGMFKFGINKIHALFQQILYDKTGNLSWSPQWPACSINLATGMASPVRKRFWVELSITQAIMMIISRLFAVIS